MQKAERVGRRHCVAALIFILLGGGIVARAADAVLKPGDRIAVFGDSITEWRLYSRNIEVYALACSGIADLDVAQFGWGADTAGGLAGRDPRTFDWFKPTVATVLYGMNDGGYTAYADAIGTAYKGNLAKCVDLLKQHGVRTIVLSSPGAVDSVQYKRNVTPAVYNDNLAHLRDLTREFATERDLPFADAHQAMVDGTLKAKAALGARYYISGDGIHPDLAGHLLMTEPLLLALGCHGDIARISIGNDGKATASPGQTVLSSEGGTVELESARWPFTLVGQPGSPVQSSRSIIPFTDFLERLDRFVLVMPDCSWTKASVRWGEKRVVIDGAKLKAGVNLMALFDVTPFDQPEADLTTAVAAQQAVETGLAKGLQNFSGRTSTAVRPLVEADADSKALYAQLDARLIAVYHDATPPGRARVEADPEAKALLEKLIARQLAVRREKLAAAHAALKSVRHRIVVAKAD